MPPEHNSVAPVAVIFEDKPKVAGVSVGIERVRSSEITSAAVARTIDAFTAGEACELFGPRAGKGGGAAFARWCAAQGVKAADRKSAEEWRPLLEQFAARPLHGHRRTAQGGNHRANRQHIR